MEDEFSSLNSGGGGTFVKWQSVGDVVDGVVVRFTLDGGRDFNGDPCPEIVLDPCTPKGSDTNVELTGDAHQIVTAGQANLKRQVLANPARFAEGHRVRITYKADAKSSNDRTFKEFDVKATPRPVTVVGAPAVTVDDDALDF
jgi:hypothetical protein